MDKHELLAALKLIEVSLKTIPFDEMEREFLILLYLTNKEILEVMELDEICLDKKIIAQHFASILGEEMRRRRLSVSKVEVRIDARGNFLSGREELKAYWKTLGDEAMFKYMDEMMKSVQTKEQRDAIAALVCEVIKET